jgi:hypothetical protein
MHTGLPAASDLDRLHFLQICAVENSSALPVDRKATGQKSLEHIGIPEAFLSASFSE